jgi:hypothetical protein
VDEVKYTDLGGNEQVWDPLLYIVEAPAGPRCQQGRFWPVYGQIWPITRPTPSAIKIKFTCGYATPAVVPYGLKAGMLLEVAEMYERRDLMVLGRTITAAELTANRLWFPFMVP